MLLNLLKTPQYMLCTFSMLWIMCEITIVVGQEDMVYCPGPTSIPCPALVQPVVWSGTVFSGECPDDSVTLSGLIPTNIGDTFPCGRFTITVTNVEIVTINPTVNVTRLTTTLNFTSDSSNNGQSVMCATAGNPPQENFNIIVPVIPTPTVSTSQSSLSTVTVNFTVTDDHCASLYIAEVTPVGGSPVTTTSPTPSVSVGGLDLCRNTYSAVGLVQASTGSQGSRSSPVDIVSGIAGVTNVMVRQSGLEWTQLSFSSSLQDCIAGYHISWPGDGFTTNDSSTSIAGDDVTPRFPYCQIVTVTVTPNTPNGVFTDGSSSGTGYIQSPNIPLPGVNASFFLRDGTIHSNITLNETVIMYGIAPLGSDCQPLFPPGMRTTSLSGAEPGDQYTVCIVFREDQCVASGDVEFTIPARSFETISSSATTTSITVTVTLPETPLMDPSQLSIYSTISPSEEDPSLTDYPSTGNSYTVTFTGLAQGTMYTYEVRVVTRDDPSTIVGLPVTGVLSTGGCGGGCIGGIVAIVAIFTVLVNSIIVVICIKKKGHKSTDEQGLTRQKTPPPPDSLYADPNAIEHTTAPDSEAQYAMVDLATKNKKKKKTTQPEALYQDPGTIEHETTDTGAEYAVVDKRASKKKKEPDVVPGPADGGLQYAAIDVSSKGRRAQGGSQRQAQEPVGSVEYSTISTEGQTL